MNFQLFLFTLVTVSLFLLTPTVLATPVDIALKDAATNLVIDQSNPFATCPVPITPQYVTVEVTNLGGSSDTYELSIVSLPEDWTGSIQEDITLAASETLPADLLLINMPSPFELFPGSYEIVIEARSLSSGHTDQATLFVDILACNAVTVEALTETQDVCTETGGSEDYDIEITNIGKFPETFSMDASMNWVTFSEPTVTLDDGESIVITATVTPPHGFEGAEDIVITAQSQDSYANGKTTISVGVTDCFDYTVSLRPAATDVCLGDHAAYILEVTNLGHEDTFTILLPSIAEADDDSLTIGSEDSAETTIIVSPEEEGTVQIDVTVLPAHDTENEQTISADINTEECRGVAVLLTPTENQVCTGDSTEYLVTLINTGSVQETYDLSASMGTLSEDQVTLDVEETVEVTLGVPTGDVGEDVITVIATAPGITDSANALLVTEVCHAATLTLVPEDGAACPCGTQEFTAILENTGSKSDTYTLELPDTDDSITLAPGEKASRTFTAELACDQETGSLDMSVVATSDFVFVETTTSLDVRSYDTCFNVELTNGEEASVDVFEGIVIPITVSNTGEVPQEFQLTVDGPEWLYMTPEAVSLDSNSDQDVYLYASPPFGTEEGDYPVTVTSTSDLAEGTYQVVIMVGENGVIDVITEDDHEEPPVLDINFEGITGDIIEGGDSDAFKTIAIGVITLIIIIILIVRFIILVRK